MGIKNIIKKMYQDVYLPKRKINYHHEELNKYLAHLDDLKELTSEEKNEIISYWAKYGIENDSFDYFKILYNITGIHDPRFMSSYVFYDLFRHSLNNRNFMVAWSDKNYLDYFLKKTPTVKSVLRNVSGRFLDKDFNLLSFEKAEKIIQSYDQLVVKPTILTSTGNNVQLHNKPYDLKKIDDLYKQNYTFQIPLKLHSELQKLSSTAINTIRINTILMEDKAYAVSGLVKVGEEGKFADNQGTQRYFIGIDKEGRLKDYGVNKKLYVMRELPNGFDFAGLKVPNLDKIKKISEEAHMEMPHFGMVFWDIVLQDNGEPVILEANLRAPDMMFNQAALGPFFGEYTDSFMEYFVKVRDKIR